MCEVIGCPDPPADGYLLCPKHAEEYDIIIPEHRAGDVPAKASPTRSQMQEWEDEADVFNELTRKGD